MSNIGPQENAMLGLEPDAALMNPQMADPGFPLYRPRVMDTTESKKLTPQILIFLVATGVRRCWKWALPTGLICGLITAAICWNIFPIRYESKAWIQVKFQKPYYLFAEKEGSEPYDKLVATYFAIIRSPVVLERALENTEVAGIPEIVKETDPVGWLSRKLRLETVAKSELFTISIEMKEQEAARAVVESVVNAFMEFNNKRNDDWQRNLNTQLLNEIHRKTTDVKHLQNKIREKTAIASQGGASSGEGGRSFQVETSLQRDVYLAEAELDRLMAGYETYKKMRDEPQNIPQEALQEAVMSDPWYQNLMLERDQLAAKLEEDQQKYSAGSARLQRTQDALNKLDLQIQSRLKKVAETKPAELTRMIQLELDSVLKEKEVSIDSQRIYVEKLREKLAQQKEQISGAAGAMVESSFDDDELRRANLVLEKLQERLVAIRTEHNAPDRTTVQKEATFPMQPKTQKQLPLTLMGGLGLLLFPFGVGIAMERMRPRLYHISQIRSAVPDIIIGEIMEPPVAWVHGASFRKRLARYRESVHAWCAHLLLSDPFNHCSTLAVASVAGDDGKTFLAIQVAVAMAQMKSGPVLLIDGDMRVGRLHLLFGNEESGVGLADVLSFRKRPGEAITMDEKEPNLHLLSAGNLVESPYELLGDGRFRELLDALQSHYSLIMVVLPPIANASESLVMAQSVDSVLLCVRQGETVLAAMEDVFRNLVNTGSNVDGIVVKDVPYYQMSGKDGGFADKLEQVRLSHLLQIAD